MLELFNFLVNKICDEKEAVVGCMHCSAGLTFTRSDHLLGRILFAEKKNI